MTFDALLEKYSEHLEMVGDSETVLIKILLRRLEKELEKVEYLEERIKSLELEEYKRCP